MAEMGRKIASDVKAAYSAQVSAEAQASAAADRAKLEHRLTQMAAEVRLASALECSRQPCHGERLSAEGRKVAALTSFF